MDFPISYSHPHLTFPFLFSNLKLPVEALNGHGRVFYRGLHGNSELVPLFPNSMKIQSIFLIQIDKKKTPLKKISSPSPFQTYIHPHSGLQALFPPLRMGSASSWKDKHHLF